MHQNLVLSLEVQSEISRFCTPARAGESGARAWNPSIQYLCTVLQSARAEDWALERSLVPQARAGIERGFHPSSTFTVRSSGKVYALACTFVA